MNRQNVRSVNYGLVEIIWNVLFLIRTKLLVSSARLIRFPITIRGKKWIDFGKRLTTGRRCRIEVNGIFDEPAIVFGENVNVGDDVRIAAAEKIKIGNNVLIGSKVLVIDNSHGSYNGDAQDSPDTPPNQRPIYTAPIVIEDNVWIGEGAIVQMGVSIGYGSIVGSNAVVTKNVPPKSIVGGVPAMVLKKYNETNCSWEKV
ncbi:DapH/DapD/GlmU-related protein [Fibrobacter succinogenes]|uniref:Acetyltransferase (Isoleucine patch superfamily) n=1 Tax=Fibrobacter succinogenes TaxID=833 RepID=A0A380RW74_FIBSU|nr:DapH/DapD/GlmU-related protein [Fibrobacter succinogenes]PWJ37009.1 acetyltransferase-like isoleucine patch superfamily enzyme [Fibrobacter succinogenes subsp. elongatus]SUQ19257.1 Acetyltransferase (isoleucine patch superfamily) [Fibrobacter succinogenes]